MANNPYVNKVQTADGRTIMDISDTTATEGDVISGKTLYKANGQKSVGTLDINGKADKVANATSGNFAGLDSNGNLTDSGKKSSDFGAPSNGIAVTALANGWSNAEPSTQTITVQGVTASNNINVGIGGSVTAEQLEAIAQGNILCTAQGANSITLTCFGEVPEINIPINVIILN